MKHNDYQNDQNAQSGIVHILMRVKCRRGEDIGWSDRLLTVGFIGLMVGMIACFFPYFIVADASFHLLRMEGLAQHFLSGGGYPCRVYEYAVSGYGYAAPIFYCDFFIVPFALLRTLGLSKSVCFEAWVISIFVIGGELMYYASKWFGLNVKQARWAAILFVVSPVLQSSLLVPCSIGGATATAFLPCLFFSICELTTRAPLTFSRRVQASLWLIIGGCGILLSHTITMALSALVFGLWCLLRVRFLLVNWRNLLALVFSAGIILLLSAWYWLPMLEQVGAADLVVFSMDQRLRLEDTISNFPLMCLFLPLWTMNAFKEYIPEWFHFSPACCSLLGWVLLPLCVVWIHYRRVLKQESWSKCVWVMLCLLLVVMTCKPLVRLLNGLLGWIQFPSRFSVFWWVGVIPLSLHCVKGVSSRARKVVLYGFLVASALAFIRPVLLRGHVWLNLHGNYPTPNTLQFNLGAGEFLPRRWATLMRHGEAYNNPMGEAAAKVFPITAKMEAPQTQRVVDETSPREITFQLFYYPGYQAFIEGIPCPVEESEEGTIALHLPEGAKGRVEVKYTGTLVQRVANWISLGALMALGVGGVVWLRFRCRSGRIANLAQS